MSLTVPVILGSVRADRAGIRAARYLVAQLEARGHAAPLIDPAELQLPLLDRMYKEYPQGQAPEPLERPQFVRAVQVTEGTWTATVTGSDANSPFWMFRAFIDPNGQPDCQRSATKQLAVTRGAEPGAK